MSENLGDAVLKLRTDDKDFNQGVKRAKGQAEQLDRSLDKTGRQSETLGKRMKKSVEQTLAPLKDLRAAWLAIAAVVGVAIAKIEQGIKASIKAIQDEQTILNTLRVSVGTAREAAREYSFIRQESDRLGLSLLTTAQSYSQFAAASKKAGLSQKEVRSLFVGTSEAITALGLSEQDAESVLLAIQQMASKGKVQSQELVLQLGQRVPGALKILADELGVTQKELFDLAQRGDLLAGDVLPKLGEGLHKAFSKEAEKNAHALRQEINRLTSSSFELEAAMGEGLAPAVGELAGELSSLAKDEEIKAGFRTLGLAISASVMPLRVLVGLAVKVRDLRKQIREGLGLGGGGSDGKPLLATLVGHFDPEQVKGMQTLDALLEREAFFKKVALDAVKQQIDETKKRIDLLGKAHEARMKQLADEAQAQQHVADVVETMLDEQAKAAAEGLTIPIQADFTDALIGLNDYQKMEQDRIDEQVRAVREKYAKAVEDIQRSFHERLYNTIADTFAEILTTGTFNFKKLADTMIHIFADTLAQMLTMWIANVAKMNAIQATVGGASGGGGLGKALGLGKLFGKGGTLSKLFSGTTGAALAAVGVTAGLLAGVNALQKSREKRSFSLGAVLKSGSSGLQAVGLGPNSQTGQAIADAMKGILQSIQESTGVLIDGIDQIQINIRRDKKKFEAVGVGIYDTAEEAIVNAMKHAITQGDIGAQLAPSIRDAIGRGNFLNPEGLQTAVQMLQQAHDAFVGLTDSEITIRNLPAEIQAFNAKLRETGVAAQDAALAEAQFAVSRFQALHDQLTGATKSEAQLKAEAERKRQLYNAERMLEITRLQAEAAKLEGQLAIARGEATLDNARIDARQAFLEGSHKIFKAQLQNDRLYLDAQAQVVGEEARLKQTSIQFGNEYTKALAKQLDALRKVIAAMPDAIAPGEIAIPKLSSHISSLGKISHQAASGVDDVKRELQSLWDWRRSLDIGQFAASSPLEQLKLASADVQRAFQQAIKLKSASSIADFKQVAQQALQIGQQFGASGPLFQGIRDQVTSLTDRLLKAGGLSVPHATQEDNIAAIADSQKEMKETAKKQLEQSRQINEHARNTAESAKSTAEETAVVAHDVRTGQNETHDLLREMRKSQDRYADRIEKLFARSATFKREIA